MVSGVIDVVAHIDLSAKCCYVLIHHILHASFNSSSKMQSGVLVNKCGEDRVQYHIM